MQPILYINVLVLLLPGAIGQGCAAGSFGTSPSCQTCGVGKWSPAGATVCTDCIAGTYALLANQTSIQGCFQCPAGTSSAEGMTTCTTCLAGTWSEQLAATCTKCSAGTYSAVGGATSVSTCTSCLEGTYSAEEIGRASCRERV